MHGMSGQTVSCDLLSENCIFDLIKNMFVQPLNNKDYSVVKTFKAGQLAFCFSVCFRFKEFRLFLLNKSNA